MQRSISVAMSLLQNPFLICILPAFSSVKTEHVKQETVKLYPQKFRLSAQNTDYHYRFLPLGYSQKFGKQGIKYNIVSIHSFPLLSLKSKTPLIPHL